MAKTTTEMEKEAAQLVSGAWLAMEEAKPDIAAVRLRRAAAAQASLSVACAAEGLGHASKQLQGEAKWCLSLSRAADQLEQLHKAWPAMHAVLVDLARVDGPAVLAWLQVNEAEVREGIDASSWGDRSSLHALMLGLVRAAGASGGAF